MATIGRVAVAFNRACNQQGFLQVYSVGRSVGHRNISNSGFSKSTENNHVFHKLGHLDSTIYQHRHMSNKNFFQTVIDNVKQDMKKNKEMKDSIAKFKQETQKLEDSDALKEARKKFESIEEETIKSSAALKRTFGDIKEKVSETVEEAQKKEFVKKGMDTASKASEAILKSGQAIGQSDAFKQISDTSIKLSNIVEHDLPDAFIHHFNDKGVKAAKDEFDNVTLARARHYKTPEKLLKRSDFSLRPKDDRQMEADDESTGVVLHKDSRFYQSWQNFKDNNQYVNKLFDLKVKYDESDNAMIRATRFFTDKVGHVFGGVFTKTEMSEVLTEICKIEPNFDREKFVRQCEKIIIPNILEAMNQGDLEVLKDWCFEAPYNTIAHPIEQARKAGYIQDSKVLDVSHADVMAGKIMEQGPVLVIGFQAQQISVVRDSKGQVVEGDPDKILRISYVWALCRDQEEFDPLAAWKLMDISASTTEQWL